MPDFRSRVYGGWLWLVGWWARRFPCPTCGTAHKRRPWYVPRWEDEKIVQRFGWLDGRCPECGATDA